MWAKLLRLSIFSPKKFWGGRMLNRSETPYYAYTMLASILFKIR